MDMDMDYDDAPKLQKLIWSIHYFFELFKEGRISEILVRIGIYVGLVILTHAIMIWAIYNILIPLARHYFLDRILNDIQKRLWSIEWRGHKLSDYDVEFQF